MQELGWKTGSIPVTVSLRFHRMLGASSMSLPLDINIRDQPIKSITHPLRPENALPNSGKLQGNTGSGRSLYRPRHQTRYPDRPRRVTCHAPCLHFLNVIIIIIIVIAMQRYNLGRGVKGKKKGALPCHLGRRPSTPSMLAFLVDCPCTGKRASLRVNMQIDVSL